MSAGSLEQRGKAGPLFLLLLVAIAAAAALWLWSSRGTKPRLSGESVSLPSLGAELLYLDASEITRRGPSRVVVLRFNEPVELVPHHYAAAGAREPLTSEQWAEKLGAEVIFNAGQFDEALEHLGWLKSDGQWLSQRRKPAWKGVLVSGPLDDSVWAQVVDLDHASVSVVERYRHAIQSMMLVDHKEKVRVRDSDLTACRSVVAEDRRGRILLIHTEGATTLGDLARWLPETELGIVRAMNLDGGIESQLVIRTEELEAAFYGQFGTGTTVFDSSPGQMIRYPLPAVIAVRPSRSNGSVATDGP